MSNLVASLEQLKERVGRIAPESVSNLNAAATAEELERLRAEVPIAPSVLLELLSLHNGEEMIAWTSLFPDGMQLMEADHIIENFSYSQNRSPDAIENLEELVAGNVMNRPRGPVKPFFFTQSAFRSLILTAN